MPKILKTEHWPQDWKRSVFIPIPKKGNARECSNYHTIALISQASKSVSSVTQLCPTLCNLMNRSTPGLPVHHQLQESTQTHVHRVSDAIQPSHPLSSTFPLTLCLSQQQGLFQMSRFFASGGQSIGVLASISVLPMNIQD